MSTVEVHQPLAPRPQPFCLPRSHRLTLTSSALVMRMKSAKGDPSSAFRLPALHEHCETLENPVRYRSMEKSEFWPPGPPGSHQGWGSHVPWSWGVAIGCPMTNVPYNQNSAARFGLDPALLYEHFKRSLRTPQSLDLPICKTSRAMATSL